MKYEEIKMLLKNYLMNQYDIRPSLAEKTVEKVFMEAANFISLEIQKDKNHEDVQV